MWRTLERETIMCIYCSREEGESEVSHKIIDFDYGNHHLLDDRQKYPNLVNATSRILIYQRYLFSHDDRLRVTTQPVETHVS